MRKFVNGFLAVLALSSATHVEASNRKSLDGEEPRSPRPSYGAKFEDNQLKTLIALLDNPKAKLAQRPVEHLIWTDIYDILTSEATKTAFSAMQSCKATPGKNLTLYEIQKEEGSFVLHKDWSGQCWSIFSQNLDPYGGLTKRENSKTFYSIRLIDDVKTRMRDLVSKVKDFARIYHFGVYEPAKAGQEQDLKDPKPLATFYIVQRLSSQIRDAVNDAKVNARYRESLRAIERELKFNKRYSVISEIKPDELSQGEQEQDFGGMAQFLGVNLPKDLTKPAPVDAKTNVLRQKRAYVRRESVQNIQWGESSSSSTSSSAISSTQDVSEIQKSAKRTAKRKLDRAQTEAHFDEAKLPQRAKKTPARGRKGSSPEDKLKGVMLTPKDVEGAIEHNSSSSTPSLSSAQVDALSSPRGEQKKSAVRLKTHARQRSRSMDEGDSRKAALKAARDAQQETKRAKSPRTPRPTEPEKK